MSYEIRLRDKGFNAIATLWPVEGAIQPERIRFDRRWRDIGSFEMEISAQTPYLSQLATLGNYIQVLEAETGVTVALYLIDRVELQTGIVRYEEAIASHVNAVYAAGQGVGDLRDVVRRLNSNSISAVGRIEGFLDARDVELGDYGGLRQRADAQLEKVEEQGAFVATAGEPKPEERLVVGAKDLLLWAERRIVLPPPATVSGDIVDCSGAAYDQDTNQADEVMKHFVNAHLINPADPARAVPNLVNGQAIPALPTLTYQGRFQTVLEALQEVGQLSGAGFEIALNASNEFEFQVLPQRDRTRGSSLPVVFRSTDVLLDVAGRRYRTDWDVGDLVTLEVSSLGIEVDVTVMQVITTLAPESPEGMAVALDTSNADTFDRFREALLTQSKAGKIAARA